MYIYSACQILDRYSPNSCKIQQMLAKALRSTYQIICTYAKYSPNDIKKLHTKNDLWWTLWSEVLVTVFYKYLCTYIYDMNEKDLFLIASEARDPCNLFLMTIIIWSNLLEIAQLYYPFLAKTCRYLPNTCQYLPNTCYTCLILAKFFQTTYHLW